MFVSHFRSVVRNMHSLHLSLLGLLDLFGYGSDGTVEVGNSFLGL